MTGSTPKVSIGLPVYNGANYVAEAIESILAQTYRDFELLVLDNASTDDTESVCSRYSDDPRFRYERQERNLGAAGNFNDVFHRTASPYFKWAAHDDYLEPEYLERCVERLEADSSVALAHSVVRQVDSERRLLRTIDLRGGIDVDDPVGRFHFVLRTYDLSVIFGVFRRDILERTPLLLSYGHSDVLLLAEGVLRGQVVVVPEPLFNWRIHPECFRESAWQDKDARAAWWAPEKGHWPLEETTQSLVHGSALLARVPLPSFDRLRCFGRLLEWLARPFAQRLERALGRSS